MRKTPVPDLPGPGREKFTGYAAVGRVLLGVHLTGFVTMIVQTQLVHMVDGLCAKSKSGERVRGRVLDERAFTGG